jgi:hypothetical protein
MGQVLYCDVGADLSDPSPEEEKGIGGSFLKSFSCVDQEKEGPLPGIERRKKTSRGSGREAGWAPEPPGLLWGPSWQARGSVHLFKNVAHRNWVDM